MTIYLDAILLLNLSFNFMILLLVRSLTQQDTSTWRLLFGAFIATLIVPLAIYFPHSFFTTLFGKFIFSIIIIFCSFKLSSLTHFLKLFFSFYFISFGIGGGLIAIHFLLNNSFSVTTQGILTYTTGFGDMISWLFVLIGFPIVWIFTKFRMDRQKVDQIRYNEIFPVSIEVNGERYDTSGFIDSGNQLTDPITRAPVIICDEQFLCQFFSGQEWRKLKQAYDKLDVDLIPEAWKKRIFIVPFKGVEGSQNILFTIRPDVLLIDYKDKKLMTTKVLIGIQFSQLTEDRRYHCLLNPKIIQTATIKSA